MREQALALGHQAAFLEQARADAGLNRLDEGTILEADLVVEGDQLLDLASRRPSSRKK